MKNYPKHLRKTLKAIIHDIAQHSDEFCNNPGHDFTRKRKIPMEELLSILVGMGGDPLRNELLKYWRYSLETASVPAFVQQRGKLKPLALETIFRQFVEKSVTPKLYCGYRLLAADGSDLQFPTNPKDPDSYIPASEKKSHFSLIHLSALYDINAGVYVDAVAQKTRNANENAALMEMIGHLHHSNPTIIIADRNYEAYNTIAHIHNRGWNYLIRLRDYKGIISKISLPDAVEFDLPVNILLTRKQTKAVKALMSQQPDVYRFLPSSAKFDYLPLKSEEFYPLSFRIVRIPIGEDSFETLITNLDSNTFPLDKLKHLYSLRWGIETAFRQLKQTVGLRMLQCKKVEHVFQEIFARLIMYNFTKLITSHILNRNVNRKYTYQVNFSAAVHICRQFIRGSVSPPKIETLLLKFLVPVRPGRKEPRHTNHIRFTGFYYRIA